MDMNEIKAREGHLSKLVAEFMDNKRAIAEYGVKQAVLKEKLEARMVINNSKVLFYNGEYIQRADNPKVSIDVAKFKGATNGREFMQCVKVDVAKARKVLSEGQVAQIMDTKSGSKLITGSIVE
jgi:hypothetical protein